MENKPYFLPHLRDLARQAEREFRVVGSFFFTPEEIALAETARLTNISFRSDGGYEEAERKRLFFYPEGLDWASDTLLFRISPKGKKFGEALTHREALGALMGLGLKREALGDLIIVEGDAYVFALPSIAEEIRRLEQVGRRRVSVEELPTGSFLFAPELDLKRISVASLRLDCIVGEAFSISRESAKKAIEEGLVSLNGRSCAKANEAVKEGDRFSLRGRGKRKIVEVIGETKKGKQALTLGIYR